MISTQEPVREDPPPVLGSWRTVYATVLVLHVLFITALYFFTLRYA